MTKKKKIILAKDQQTHSTNLRENETKIKSNCTILLIPLLNIQQMYRYYNYILKSPKKSKLHNIRPILKYYC